MATPRTRTVTPTTLPRLGLVCITHDTTIRYRTLTRARFLTLTPADQRRILDALYRDNIATLDRALTFCHTHHIPLYRVTSALFPFSDEPLGIDILHALAAPLAAVGRRAATLPIRIVVHPDQFVVLSSDSPHVIDNSIKILRRHALALDLLQLPVSPWSAINIHGGKSGRADRLVDTIASLPDNIRCRLTLENDEHAYSAEAIHHVCTRANVPMVFDNLHHAVHENLPDYAHPSFAHWTAQAQHTWPNPDWQIVHLSNGIASPTDPRHSDTITTLPPAYRQAPWIEVEAKAKETAIESVRKLLTTSP